MTERPILVGVLDSGVDDAVRAKLVDEAGFHSAGDGSVVRGATSPDRLAHGSVIARTIVEAVPRAGLLVGQIFQDRMTTTPAQVAAGLDWMREAGARVVTMSFGLRADRAVLRQACVKAHEAEMILLAASPARGAPVYPAAYPEVIAISGDARLGPGELSALNTGQADFGAYAWPAGVDDQGRPVAGGASFAVATAAAATASFLLDNATARPADVIAHFTAISRYHGPEQKLHHGD